jgi:6-phosphogluconolactonase (cycloisomerase 2 family)
MPRVQNKRGTAANLTSVDPTPLAGELIVVTDENTLVIGNGTDAYTSLAYVTATPRSHTHTLSQITDLNIASAGSPAVGYDVALSYNYSSATWSTKTIGNVGVGSQPFGGWPAGSLGNALAGKAGVATTLAGYGITDAVSATDARLTDSRTPLDGSVTTAKIADDAVTYAKLQNVSATDRLLGRSSAGAGDIEEIACTAFGRSLIDDADAAAGRATLGAAPAESPTFTGTVTVPVGSATSPSVAISGDSNTGLFQATASADTLSIAANGSEVAQFGSTRHQINRDTLFSGTTGVLSGNAGAIFASGSDHFRLYGNTTSQFTIARVSGLSTTPDEDACLQVVSLVETDTRAQVRVGAFNSLALPQYSFIADTNTGLANPQADQLSVITNGSDRIRVSATGLVGIGTTSPSSLLHVAGVITVSAGTAALPALVPSGDANTGILFPAADTVAISTAGSERVRVKDNGVVRFVPLSADPTSPQAGDVYYHTTLNKLRVYNGSRWVSTHGGAWDVSTAEYVQSFSVSAKETLPTQVAFRPDGLKMYVIGNDSDNVHEYTLSVAWDISTATFGQSFSVSAQENSPQSLFFKPDGLKMYVLGTTGDDISEYNLSTAWDISTATYQQVFSVQSQESGPTGLFFKPDGLKVYICGNVSDSVHEYTLSTAWDVSTASHAQSLGIIAEEGSSSDLFFSPDGTRMYVIGAGGDDVNQYALSTAWDISTATYIQVRSVQPQDNDPRGLWFSPDGLRMYMVGATSDAVHQYSLM